MNNEPGVSEQKPSQIKAVLLFSLLFFLVAATTLWIVKQLNQKAPTTTKKETVTPQKESTVPQFTRNYTSIAFNPATTFLKVQQTANINMVIDTGLNTVTGAEFILKYDPKYLEITSVTPAGFYEKPVVLANKNENAKGLYSYAIATMTPKSGNGNLVTVSVKALSFGSTKIEFLEDPKIADKNESSNNVLKTKENAILEITQ